MKIDLNDAACPTVPSHLAFFLSCRFPSFSLPLSSCSSAQLKVLHATGFIQEAACGEEDMLASGACETLTGEEIKNYHTTVLPCIFYGASNQENGPHLFQ